ncbi:Telomeric repeat-binding factor 2-interacting protein 1 [Saguinus oedipus]|uniref:Telomeric repeat-binding factor 2-interacting protein 1 n=1 Tax=Saguinus oedipus TaxID=9490 RepID=A0ABQ9TLC2_SAGOE|nr:Telomeric repeat-binding factor 2-interacting protein 1 [Saguinus oedipus]
MILGPGSRCGWGIPGYVVCGAQRPRLGMCALAQPPRWEPRAPPLPGERGRALSTRGCCCCLCQLRSECQALARGHLFECSASDMAEAMDLGKDPNGPTHSSTLFVREDGSSMSFYVRPSPAKRRLSTLILHGGGTLCRVQEPGAVLLAQPGEALAEASGDFISTQYILDCVEQNERLELETYRLGPASAADTGLEAKPGALGEGSVEPEPQRFTGRIAYTESDDVAILTYVKENARSPSSVTGNALWKAMEKSSITQHSWQSLKDRYLKHLRGQEHKYLLGDAPVSPSSQKLKRKAEEDPEAADSGGETAAPGAPRTPARVGLGSFPGCLASILASWVAALGPSPC